MNTPDDEEITRDWRTSPPPAPRSGPRADAPRASSSLPARHHPPPPAPPHGQPPGWPPPPTPTGWGSPPVTAAPPQNHNAALRWIAGGVVAVVVIAAAAFGLHRYVLTPNPAADSNEVRADESTTAKAPVPTSAMSGLLLTTSQATSIYGTSMGAGKNADAIVYDFMKAEPVVDQDWNASAPVNASSHLGSGWKTVRWQKMTNDATTLFQAVVGFGDAAAAQKFVDDRQGAWQSCVHRGGNLKYTDAAPDEPDSYWAFGDVTSSQGTVTKILTAEGVPDYTCTHVMAPRNNVVIELSLCGSGPQPVDTIVATIAKNVEEAS